MGTLGAAVGPTFMDAAGVSAMAGTAGTSVGCAVRGLVGADEPGRVGLGAGSTRVAGADASHRGGAGTGWHPTDSVNIPKKIMDQRKRTAHPWLPCWEQFMRSHGGKRGEAVDLIGRP